MTSKQTKHLSFGWVVPIRFDSDEDRDEKLEMMVEFNEFNEVPIEFNLEGTLAYLDCQYFENLTNLGDCDTINNQTVVGDQFGNVVYLFDYLNSFDVDYDEDRVQPFFSVWQYNERNYEFSPLEALTLEQFSTYGAYKCSLRER